ncbi:hypothetical protein TURU_086581 [Turdus rufiventris]|nr:hypothetical protein TURU_086581 [Turdus rufiventris]
MRNGCRDTMAKSRGVRLAFNGYLIWRNYINFWAYLAILGTNRFEAMVWQKAPPTSVKWPQESREEKTITLEPGPAPVTEPDLAVLTTSQSVWCPVAVALTLPSSLRKEFLLGSKNKNIGYGTTVEESPAQLVVVLHQALHADTYPGPLAFFGRQNRKSDPTESYHQLHTKSPDILVSPLPKHEITTCCVGHTQALSQQPSQRACAMFSKNLTTFPGPGQELEKGKLPYFTRDTGKQISPSYENPQTRSKDKDDVNDLFLHILFL